jgi:hypothetical protein
LKDALEFLAPDSSNHISAWWKELYLGRDNVVRKVAKPLVDEVFMECLDAHMSIHVPRPF